MRNISYEAQTQNYSTFGDKLLQHTDRLFDIQNNKNFTPITIQLAPTELCFTGDTIIPLLDGTEKTLKELADTGLSSFWVYSYDITKKKIVPGLALRSRNTRKSSQIVEILLDNGEKIKCTEDHKFLLRSGEYKEASQLSRNESLMPLYRKSADMTIEHGKMVGYEMILDVEKDAWVFTHRVVRENSNIKYYTYVNGGLQETSYNKHFKITHHLSFNKKDNTPTNLVAMSFEDHTKYHKELNLEKIHKGIHPFQIYTRTKKHRDRSSRQFHKMNLKRSSGELPYPKKSESALNNIKELTRKRNLELSEKGIHPFQIAALNSNSHLYNEVFRKENSERLKRLASEGKLSFQRKDVRKKNSEVQKVLIKEGRHAGANLFKTEEFRKKNSERQKQLALRGENSLQRVAKEAGKYSGYLKVNHLTKEDYSFSEYKRDFPNNHKVVSVTLLGKEDVYCLEVEKYHNFALSAGVFVSNCDSDCPFCSVGERNTTKKIPFKDIVLGLMEFKKLGATAVEITGGGNPLLYKDNDDGLKRNINDIIKVCADLDYKIGIITNSENLKRHLNPELASSIDWIRISLIKLDEGKNVEDFNFDGFDIKKLGFSYIIYENTTVESIRKIANLVERFPDIKFVRIAADCLTENSITIKEVWGDIVEEMDKHKKFFIKEINENFKPYPHACYVGAIRPYWVWNGIYICTSHVLKHRNYHPMWKLCDPHQIAATWENMNKRFKEGKMPYDIDIANECAHCYYFNNNKLLDTVIKPLPDKEFV